MSFSRFSTAPLEIFSYHSPIFKQEGSKKIPPPSQRGEDTKYILRKERTYRCEERRKRRTLSDFDSRKL